MAKYPKTEEELLQAIREALDTQGDLNKEVEGVAKAAAAAFEYACGKTGASGFSSSISSLKFMALVRGIKGPFMLLAVEKMLYPQHKVLKDAREFMEGKAATEFLRAEAQKLLQEKRAEYAKYAAKGQAHPCPPHPDVLAHWEYLAQQ